PHSRGGIFYSPAALRTLHSFPTRRSSDLHLQPFRLAQMTEMPDEMHQLPTVLSIAVIPSPVMLVAGKCRHAGKPHSVLDNPEQFAVAQVLRRRQPQIGGFRIKSLADWRVAAAVIPVANRTMIGKVQPIIEIGRAHV